MNLDKKKNFIIDFIYIAIWFLIIFIAVKALLVYLFPFVIGVIIAYIVQRPAFLLSKKIKVKKEICASVFSVFFYILFVALLLLFLWIIYVQGNKLVDTFGKNDSINLNVKNVLNTVKIFFEKFNFSFGNTIDKVLTETSNGLITKFSIFLSNALSSFVKKIPELLISSAITIVATFYISKDYDKLRKFVLGIISADFCKRFIEIKNIFIECFLKISVGYFWLYMITFLELIFGFTLLGISNYVLFALIISFVDLLPVLGTGTVLLPWAIVKFLQNDIKLGVGLTILYVVIAIIRNFIEPKIIGRQTGINPLFTLMFIFLGLRMGGVIGMLVIPVILTVTFIYLRQEILSKNN